MSKAAQSLGMTQPAVSNHVQALEAGFGSKLFYREARGVKPTPIGSELLRSVGDHIEAAESAFERLRARSSSLVGTVHFGGPAEFVGAKMPAIFSTLSQMGVDFRVTLGGKDNIYKAFGAGEIELGITASEPQDPALGFVPIFREKLVLVGSPAAAMRVGTRDLTPDDIGGIGIVAYDEALPLVRSYMIAMFGASTQTKARIVVPNLSIVRDILISGNAASVLPEYLCEAHLAAGHLVLLHRPPRAPTNQLFLVWRKEAMRTPRVVFVRDKCREILSTNNR